MIFNIILNIPLAIEWRNRRIYQLMTDRFATTLENKQPCSTKQELFNYCGGTFKAMVSQLDYIKNLGYNAIWISPTVQQTNYSNEFGSSYHGYWWSNLYGTNTNFGSDEDLQNLVSEAHLRDIWVMTDVVYNHMGYCEGGKEDYSCIATFPKAEHYHKLCAVENWADDDQLQNCRIYNLPDLNQSVPFVRETLLNWTTWYMNKFGFDGMRLDAARHVGHDFWRDLRKISPWYQIAEIFDDNISNIKKFISDDELFSTMYYPMYNDVKNVIGLGQSFQIIHDHFLQMQAAFGDRLKDIGVFFENHDNPRFLEQTNDLTRFETAIALIHTWIGIPIGYYGTEQKMKGGADPECRRPLWQTGYDQQNPSYLSIQTLNELRNEVQIHLLEQFELGYSENYYAFQRGDQLVVILVNQLTDMNIKVNVFLEPNTQLCDVLGEDCYFVDKQRTIDVIIKKGHSVVLQIEETRKIHYLEISLYVLLGVAVIIIATLLIMAKVKHSKKYKKVKEQLLVHELVEQKEAKEDGW